jgi:hypothetical protein
VALNVGDILIGAVAGAVGAIGFCAGLALLGNDFLGTVGAGAFSGALAGQYTRLTEALLSGRNLQVGKDFLNPFDIVADAALGGFLGGVGYGAGQLLNSFENLKGLGQYGVPDEYFGDYFDDLNTSRLNPQDIRYSQSPYSTQGDGYTVSGNTKRLETNPGLDLPTKPIRIFVKDPIIDFWGPQTKKRLHRQFRKSLEW